MQTEPFLQLFIPNAACLECLDNCGLPSIDVVALLKSVRSNMVMEWTETLELMMEFESLMSSLSDQLQCLFAVVLCCLLCPAVCLFLFFVF